MRLGTSAGMPPPLEPAAAEREKGELLPKLKSILVVPDATRNQDDASNITANATLPERAPSSKPPATQAGGHLYSKVVRSWERGESSRFIAAQEEPVSLDWQKARRGRWWKKDEALQMPESGRTMTMAKESQTSAQERREAFKRRLIDGCF